MLVHSRKAGILAIAAASLTLPFACTRKSGPAVSGGADSAAGTGNGGANPSQSARPPGPQGKPGWLRVTADHLPLFREPEADADELGGFVSRGTLLERLDDRSVPVEGPGSEPQKKLPGARPPSAPIPGKGPL